MRTDHLEDLLSGIDEKTLAGISEKRFFNSRKSISDQTGVKKTRALRTALIAASAVLVCVAAVVITVLLKTPKTEGDSLPLSYLIISDAYDGPGGPILDSGNYPQLPFDTKAPDPDKKELILSFCGREYNVTFYRSQFAGDGNYFYDYKSETGEIFTVDVNGMTVGIKRSFSSINENKTYDGTPEELTALATDFFEDAFGKEVAERYIADPPKIAPGYSTVDFHLTDDQKDSRFIYVDRVTFAILPDGELYFILGRNLCRFDGKTVPDYFTDEYIERSVAELIKEKDVTVSVLKDEMRMITVNNGTLACKVGIEVTKGETSQLAEVLFVFDYMRIL